MSDSEGHYKQSIFLDALGRELEAHQCEYCREIMPVKVWVGPDFSSKKFKEKYHILMVQVDKEKGKIWVCHNCAADMGITINKISYLFI